VADIDWPLLSLCVGVSVAVGLLIYHGVAGYYHLRYYTLRRDEPQLWKCQPKRFLTPKQHRTAVLLGSANMTLGGVLSGAVIYLIARGMETPIFYDVADYGWVYVIASTLGLFVLMDAIAYYVHRLLHVRFLFRALHRHHHKYVATSPYVVTALHPLELVLLQAATLAPVFFIPFHAASIGAVLVYVLIFNIVDHSGVRLTSSLPWQGPSMYHDDHHAHFHVNFGQHLMIWDRLHGTLRVPGRTYGRNIFGGKGAPQPKGKRIVEEFNGY